MDGLDELQKSPQWEALNRAKEAAHDLAISIEYSELPGRHEAYSALVEITRVENQLRRHFRERNGRL